MEECWRRLYEAAILETDGSKISDRITAAELAIRARMEEIARDPASSQEQSAISDAMSGLRILQAELRAGNWIESSVRRGGGTG
jgi:hypothetical protein